MNNPEKITRTIFIAATVLSAVLFTAKVGIAQRADSAAIPVDLEDNGQDRIVTVKQAVEIALANNTQMKQALLSVKDADQQVLSAWGEVMPSISSDMSYTRNMEIPVNFIPARVFDPSAPAGQLVPVQFGTDNNWSGGITINQTLFSGQALVGISSSAVYKLVQSENYRATSQQIVTQTRIAYYNVLIAEERLSLQQASIRRLEKNLKENQARQRAGLLDEYDVLRVEVQLSNQRPQLTQAEYAVSKAYRELKITMGLPLEFDFRVEGNLREYNLSDRSSADSVNASLKSLDTMTPLVLDPSIGLTEKAFDLRGDLRILDARDELTDRQLLAARSRYFPSLSASYQLRWNASERGDPNFFASDRQRARSQAISLSFSLPLFQGMQRHTAVQRAQIQEKEIALQRENARRAAKNEIQSARESIRQALETEEARIKALRQARRGYEIANTRLDQGIGSQLDVTNAEIQYREAELNYAVMVFNYLRAKARYDQALGMVPFVDKTTNPIEEGQ
ncbi:MAG: TolC family protein [Candidatus Marinimicrobia bacterium]|nr:TolC family protein [Candidatus Neomarinimicrobiota bacterium]MCF7828233.1 TolC family protein [Candidatus Neomarinimicrobiota bacterium]MCF7879592.1 TolC family protein [Candidatus Neomarinimicrobiota bacterium]